MSIAHWIISALAMLLLCSVHAADLDTFETLDPAELKQAEAMIQSYLEPGTARLLREPRNDAERYVVARQQRLAILLQHRNEPIDLGHGEQVQRLFWPVARASRVRLDEQGQAVIECVSASTLLGRVQPDFRQGNGERRPVR